MGKSEVDRNEMTHYEIINEKATLLQCFWINIQVTFQIDELFLCSSEQNEAHFQPDAPNALWVKAEEGGINPPGSPTRGALGEQPFLGSAQGERGLGTHLVNADPEAHAMEG